jgi:hypothetical protein
MCTTLTEVTLPSTCTSIENYVFANCSNLTNITLPSGLLFIGENAFYQSGLTGSIVLPNTILRIRNGAFNGTKITSITYPASLTQTYGGTSEKDSYTDLKRLYLPGSVNTL